MIGLRLDQVQLRAQQGPLGVDLFEIGRIAGAVAVGRVAQCFGDRRALGELAGAHKKVAA